MWFWRLGFALHFPNYYAWKGNSLGRLLVVCFLSRDNLLELDVYFEEMSTQYIKQVPAYDEESLFGESYIYKDISYEAKSKNTRIFGSLNLSKSISTSITKLPYDFEIITAPLGCKH